MKIRIEDFGPVKDFSIDLTKDFHLFVGRNNIGKSYAITAVYVILKAFEEVDFVSIFRYARYIETKKKKNFEKNILKIGEIAKNLKLRQEENINSLVEESVSQQIVEVFNQKLQNSLINTFSSLDNLNNQYSGKTPVITLITDELTVKLALENNTVQVNNIILKQDYVIRNIKSNRRPNKSVEKIIIYYNRERPEDFLDNYSFEVVLSILSKFFGSYDEISSVHYLPASRSGLYQALSAFGQIIAELSKNRSFLSKKIELPGISEPVSDYFIRLSDIRVNKKFFEGTILNDIAKEIEDKILKGNVEFNSQTKQLMFFPNDTNLKLELSSTSSMVSELAPIVSYLRYVLTEPYQHSQSMFPRHFRRDSKRSHIIMIEEPEAHLHPEVQLQLTEIFSQLVKADVKLIVTSHSNYIFNKINNLIMSEDFDASTVCSGVFKSTSEGSIMVNLDINELGVEDDNFTVATNNLFEEKMSIIDNYNKNECNIDVK